MNEDKLTLGQLLKGYKRNLSGRIQVWWCGCIVTDCTIHELFPYFKLANVECFDVVDDVLIVAVSCSDYTTVLGRDTEFSKYILEEAQKYEQEKRKKC